MLVLVIGVSVWFVVEVAKLHPTIHIDGHPGLHQARRRNYTTSEDTNLAGLRGEESIAALCRREGISESLYYTNGLLM